MPKLIRVEHRKYGVSFPLTQYNKSPEIREAYERVCAATINAVKTLAPKGSWDENQYRARIDDCALMIETTSNWCLRDPWEEGWAALHLEIVGPRGKTWRIARDIGVRNWKDVAKKEVVSACENASLYDSELRNLALPGLVHRLYELKMYGRRING